LRYNSRAIIQSFNPKKRPNDEIYDGKLRPVTALHFVTSIRAKLESGGARESTAAHSALA
jgi:hypothetical protein